MGDEERFDEEVPQEVPAEVPEVEYEEVAEEELFIEPYELFEDEEHVAKLEACKNRLDDTLISGVPPETFEAAAEGEALGLENVVGVDIGEKEVDGEPTGEPCVVVYVIEKAPRDRLQAAAAVPEEVEGVRTDIVATGEIEAFRHTARYGRPAPCGVSIGNYRSRSAGTLGCLLLRGREIFGLTNNHVAALSNRGRRRRDVILQPGVLDGGISPRDAIGVLWDFVPIDFSGRPTNDVDAAIFRVIRGRVRPDILRKGRPRRFLAPVRIGMTVQKSGRTTQLTVGRVVGRNATIRVGYRGVGAATFRNQIAIRGIGRAFSAPGDSGSLVTERPGPCGTGRRPVGLLFAGNQARNFTFANPIAAVLRAFRGRIWGF